MDFSFVDDVVRVHDKECFQMTRRLAREEGLFAGSSAGAAVAGGLKYVRLHDRPGLNVVILLPDSGSRYLSKVYNDQWMEEQGFSEPQIGLGTVRDILAGLGQRELVSVKADTRIHEAIGLMKLHGISQMPVMRDGVVVGCIHEAPLLERALKTGNKDLRVTEAADMNYCTVNLDTEVAVVTDLLRKMRIALVLDSEQHPIGVLTRIDVLDHVARLTQIVKPTVG